MNRLLLALAVSLPLAAACTASQPRPQSGLATRDANGNKVICGMEKPIGSNIAEMRCRTEESIEGTREAAQQAIHTTPKSGLSPKNN